MRSSRVSAPAPPSSLLGGTVLWDSGLSNSKPLHALQHWGPAGQGWGQLPLWFQRCSLLAQLCPAAALARPDRGEEACAAALGVCARCSCSFRLSRTTPQVTSLGFTPLLPLRGYKRTFVGEGLHVLIRGYESLSTETPNRVFFQGGLGLAPWPELQVEMELGSLGAAGGSDLLRPACLCALGV